MEYQVIYPLRHNGKRYAPQEVVQMSAKEAAPLLNRGILLALGTLVNSSTHGSTATLPPTDNLSISVSMATPLNSALPPADNLSIDAPDDAPSEDDEAVEQIVALFKQWQGDGDKLAKKPNIDAVRKALSNKDLDATERDKAWDIYAHHADDDTDPVSGDE